jgi:squalene-hopene/tetraprenyl-beta-curcumene cyclase
MTRIQSAQPCKASPFRFTTPFWVILGLFLSAGALEPVRSAPVPNDQDLGKKRNTSLANEVRHSIRRGLDWLARSQNTNGFWSSPDYPAITALGLTACRLAPEAGEAVKPAVDKGYRFLMSCVQPDGGIYRTELPSYNTSICLVAVVLRNRAEDQALVTNARRFIVGLQTDLNEPGKIDSPFDGGVGYGKSDKQPDLSNTSFAIEALHLSREYLKDKSPGALPDLNWKAAIRFIEHCQNLPSHNSEPWASDDTANRGGFIYAPGRSMAGEAPLASGRVALRSYGSMSYAGLLSYIYADLKSDDPRVIAVRQWLRENYTVDENPALGSQGLYYYYHTMARALTATGADMVEVKGGKPALWREDLANKLMHLQREDGSWVNDNARWFEKDPCLVTAYSLISLDLVYKGL